MSSSNYFEQDRFVTGYALPEMPKFLEYSKSPANNAVCRICASPYELNDPLTDHRLEFVVDYSIPVRMTQYHPLRWICCDDCAEDAGDGGRYTLDVESGIAGRLAELYRITGTIPRAADFSTYARGTASRSRFLNDSVLLALGPDGAIEVITLLTKIPSSQDVNEVYGSWHAALVAAGVLSTGVERTARGTKSLARDGHLCHSYGERVIDDWLSDLGIPHSREPHYPNSNFRADFEIAGTFVEFFGLAGDEKYDEKSDQKRSMALLAGIKLIEVFQRDIDNWQSYADEFESALGLLPSRVDAILSEATPESLIVHSPTQLVIQTSAEGPLRCATAAGWFVDPFREGRFRFYDGSAWTPECLSKSGRRIRSSAIVSEGVDSLMFPTGKIREREAAKARSIESLLDDMPAFSNSRLRESEKYYDIQLRLLSWVDKNETEALEKMALQIKRLTTSHETQAQYSLSDFVGWGAHKYLMYFYERTGNRQAEMAVAERFLLFTAPIHWGPAHRTLTLLARDGYLPSGIEAGFELVSPRPDESQRVSVKLPLGK